ncbi:glycosyl hydrolase family 8 [Sorangium sp. So ce693]|uniref:glycosyl hydrolase family 8 n=1 Tax=Sorangium sp. So ce693 TaxID=3133318 RepID=UPI003F6262AF
MGEYRNLFAENGRTQDEVNAKIAAAWDHLFKGDPAEQSAYFEQDENDNGPLAQIRDIASEDVRSEGMSYGMMIAVQTDHQAEFNALWNWAKTYMFHADETHPAYAYSASRPPTSGPPISSRRSGTSIPRAGSTATTTACCISWRCCT